MASCNAPSSEHHLAFRNKKPVKSSAPELGLGSSQARHNQPLIHAYMVRWWSQRIQGFRVLEWGPFHGYDGGLGLFRVQG